MTIAMNAYYKIANKRFKGGFVESDIDLIQLFYDAKDYPYLNDYKEVSFGDAKLLLFEMKTNNTSRNYKKALHQLQRSKDVIRKYTDYQNIDCFYAFNVSNSIVWRFEDIK